MAGKAEHPTSVEQVSTRLTPNLTRLNKYAPSASPPSALNPQLPFAIPSEQTDCDLTTTTATATILFCILTYTSAFRGVHSSSSRFRPSHAFANTTYLTFPQSIRTAQGLCHHLQTPRTLIPWALDPPPLNHTIYLRTSDTCAI